MLWFTESRRARSPRVAKAGRIKASPCIEPLESRRLFSHAGFHIIQSGQNETAWLSRPPKNAIPVNVATILPATTGAAVNVLTVYGTTGNDTVTITDSQVILNSQVLNFGSAVEIVYVDNGGNDSITVNAPQTPVFVYVGSASSDAIRTQSGNVYLLYT